MTTEKIEKYDLSHLPSTEGPVPVRVHPTLAVQRLDRLVLRRGLHEHGKPRFAVYEEKPAPDDTSPETPVLTFTFPADELTIIMELNLTGVAEEFHIHWKSSALYAGLGVSPDTVIAKTHIKNHELFLEMLPHRHPTSFTVNETGELVVVNPGVIPRFDD